MSQLATFDDWGLLQQQSDLNNFIALATSAPYLAVDTEFRREDTYFAELALIQVATDEAVACIDPLAGLDLNGLTDLLRSDQPTLLHSVYQDAEILSTALGCQLANVLDTQIAAAFAGESLQLSYRDAVNLATGQTLDKGASRSDWMQRPLTPTQLQYAKLDVTYLADIRDHFFARLDETRQEWVANESQRQVLEASQIAPASVILNRIKLRYPVEASVARRTAQLHLWRESLAVERNIPRRWVVGDQTLLNLALSPELSDWAIEAILAEDKHAALEQATAIKNILEAADKSSQDYTCINPIRDPDIKMWISTITQHCNELARQLGISTGLLASRKMIVAWTQHRPTPLTEGWRGELLGDYLQKLRQTSEMSNINFSDANNDD